MDDLPREDLLAAIDRAVGECLAAAGVTGPPVDAVELARRHFGLAVVLEPPGGHGGRRRSVREDGVLRLPVGGSPESRQELAARAVGDRLRQRVLEELRLDPDAARGLTGASLTNLIARHLLVPRAWFRRDARQAGCNVSELARRYSTAGVESVALRLLDLDEPCVVTVLSGDHLALRKSNGPRAGRVLTPAERRCGDGVRRTGEPQTVREEGWAIWGWPVGADRVVLRGVPESEG